MKRRYNIVRSTVTSSDMFASALLQLARRGGVGRKSFQLRAQGAEQPPGENYWAGTCENTVENADIHSDM